jgi:hypothetical protein
MKKFKLWLFAMGLTPILQAGPGIVYSGSQDHVMVQSGTLKSFSVSIGGFGESILIRSGRASVFMLPASNSQHFSTVFQPGLRFFPVTALEEAAVIGGGSAWAGTADGTFLVHDPATVGFGDGGFFDQQNKYIAIRALDNNEAFYGWIRVSHSLEQQQFVVHDWAWNSVAGEPILAGQIPEPRTVALWIGLGAAGLALGRRKRFRGGPAR